MSYLGTRNAVALGVSQHMTLGGSNLLETLSPSLLLQFVGAETLDPRITFTRASTATFTGSNGLIQTAAINAPRFDYNPTTLASLGLLIEEQRTNLLTYSKDFGNAIWLRSGATALLNTTVAPDGTITADSITFSASGDIIYQNIAGFTYAAGASYTFSIFIKSALRAITYGGGTAAGTDVYTSTLVGNGWYRQTLTRTFTAAGTSVTIQPMLSGAQPIGVGTFAAWGSQFEAGAFATSYIPTVASQVTRAADVAVMTGTNFSDWYNATEGTLFANFVWEGLRSVPGQRIMSLDDGTTTTYWGMLATGGNGMQNPVVIAGTTDATNSTPSTSYAPFTSYKQAVALALNDSVGAINGVAGTTDTVVGVPPGLIAARFAGSSTGTISNIWFSQLVYYPRRLSNAELRAITS